MNQGQENSVPQPTRLDVAQQVAQNAQPIIDHAVQTGQVPPLPQGSAPQAQTAVLTVKFEEDLILHVTPETVNDMRFLELYEEVSESEFKIPKLLKFMFGEAQYDGIFKYYEAKGQKFTITKMGEVFEKLDQDLNSNPDFLRQ